MAFATDDHKPSNPEERARVEAAGGTVEYDRVCGNLAVSRAVGDFCYKQSSGTLSTVAVWSRWVESCVPNQNCISLFTLSLQRVRPPSFCVRIVECLP